MKRLTILIPCYNEADGIAQVIRSFKRGDIAAQGYELDILVIDNNSSDGTAEVAEAAGARVIHEAKQGKGNAIRTGFNSIGPETDYVVMLDGDNTYRPEEVLRLVEPIRSGFCNVVIGSRLGGRISQGSMTGFNRLGNWIFSHLVRYSYRVNVTDVLTGYFAWSRPAVEALRPHLKSNGFAIEMEMITKMARLGEEIYSVPISYHARAGESSLSPIGDGSRILKMYLQNLTWKPLPPKPQRLAFVSDAIMPFHKGGKEKRLSEITRRLVCDNREVHVYTMKWWDGPSTIQHEGVWLHAICPKLPLYKNGRRTQSEAIVFGLATFKLLFARFDVLDVDSMPFFPVFSARLVCWLRGKKLYSTWHEVTSRSTWLQYAGPITGTAGWLIERAAMLMPDVIVSVSQHTTKRLRTSGVKQTVLTIPLGVNLQTIYDTKPAPQTSDIIFVGRLLAHKNVDLLVRAVAIVKQTHPGVTLNIIGNGPQKPKLEGLIKRFNLKSNVRLLGIIPSNGDVYGLMKASKVLVLPSVREGFSLVTIEANAAGIPVITTNHPDNAARDLISEGVNGYLTEVSAEAIAEQILRILSPKTKLVPMQGIEQYDWNTITKNLEQHLVG